MAEHGARSSESKASERKPDFRELSIAFRALDQEQKKILQEKGRAATAAATKIKPSGSAFGMQKRQQERALKKKARAAKVRRAIAEGELPTLDGANGDGRRVRQRTSLHASAAPVVGPQLCDVDTQSRILKLSQEVSLQRAADLELQRKFDKMLEDFNEQESPQIVNAAALAGARSCKRRREEFHAQPDRDLTVLQWVPVGIRERARHLLKLSTKSFIGKSLFSTLAAAWAGLHTSIQPDPELRKHMKAYSQKQSSEKQKSRTGVLVCRLVGRCVCCPAWRIRLQLVNSYQQIMKSIFVAHSNERADLKHGSVVLAFVGRSPEAPLPPPTRCRRLSLKSAPHLVEHPVPVQEPLTDVRWALVPEQDLSPFRSWFLNCSSSWSALSRLPYPPPADLRLTIDVKDCHGYFADFDLSFHWTMCAYVLAEEERMLGEFDPAALLVVPLTRDGESINRVIWPDPRGANGPQWGGVDADSSGSSDSGCDKDSDRDSDDSASPRGSRGSDVGSRGTRGTASSRGTKKSLDDDGDESDGPRCPGDVDAPDPPYDRDEEFDLFGPDGGDDDDKESGSGSGSSSSNSSSISSSDSESSSGSSGPDSDSKGKRRHPQLAITGSTKLAYVNDMENEKQPDLYFKVYCTVHKRCARRRTAPESKVRRAKLQKGQGRCLGCLAAWALDAETFATAKEHKKYQPGLIRRRRARDELKDVDGAEFFFVWERDKRGIEADSEPEAMK